MKVLRLDTLPAAPLDAAALFHAHYLPRARSEIAAGHDIVLVFGQGGKPHRTWRRAAVQELAREAAPLRVNGIEGADLPGEGEIADYIASAPGVTGQVFALG